MARCHIGDSYQSPGLSGYRIMEPVVAVFAVVLGPFHEESQELKFDMEIVELEKATYT